MWLPALGAVLFLIAALFWGLSSSDAPKAAGSAPGAADAGAAAH